MTSAQKQGNEKMNTQPPAADRATDYRLLSLILTALMLLGTGGAAYVLVVVKGHATQAMHTGAHREFEKMERATRENRDAIGAIRENLGQVRTDVAVIREILERDRNRKE